MPDAEHTDVDVIPKDWLPYTIGDLVELEGGSQPDKSEFRATWKPNYVRLIQIRDYKTDKYETFVPVHLARRFCNEQDIMIGRYGPPVFQILRGIKGAYNVALIKATPKRDVNVSFAYYFLKQESLFDFIEKLSQRSSGQTGVDLQELKRYPFPLPPHFEQEAIAEALTDVDALIESLEQLIVKKRCIKQGTMQELLTGKKRLPEFNGNWNTMTFGEIFDYHSTATNSRSDLSESGDTFYIHYGDIHTKFHNHLDFSHERPPLIDRRLCKNATSLKNGDWVLADASEDLSGVGKSVEILGLDTGITAVAGLHTLLLRERVATFAPGFKGHLGNLRSLHNEFLRVTTGMKVFGVSKTALKDLRLPVPTQAEQAAIASILSDMDAEIAALEAKLDKARQLKQGMMHELLTGRIRLV